MTQYIIEEYEIVTAENNLFSFRERKKEWADEIRSRPYDPQAEREKVLDKLNEIIDDAISKLFTGTEDPVSSHARHKAFAWTKMKISELRQENKEE